MRLSLLKSYQFGKSAGSQYPEMVEDCYFEMMETMETMDSGEMDKLREEHDVEERASDLPIVRSNTPRPLSFDMMLSGGGQIYKLQQDDSAPLPTFPAEAPSAPPLPEEMGTRDTESGSSTISAIPLSSRPEPLLEETREFTWLFEYGLEMDSAILNSPERLDGLALLYGPAVLRGYTVMFGTQRINGQDGTTLAALVPAADTNAEVWGVLYRIPRRLTESMLEEPSLLDTIHAAIPPQNFYQAVQAVVHETYRERDLDCVTYVATEAARQDLQLVPVEQWDGDTLFVQRLAIIARKQKLPDTYLKLYESVAIPVTTEKVATLHLPLDTDPLPAVRRTSDARPKTSSVKNEVPATDPGPVPPAPATLPRERRLIIFALYLVFVLLLVLVFAVLQGLGMGRAIFSGGFAILGVPWLVMIYGLLGGCISSMMTLLRYPYAFSPFTPSPPFPFFQYPQSEREKETSPVILLPASQQSVLYPKNSQPAPDPVQTWRAGIPPLFVLITWFARPFIGAILASLTYLLLTSGFFVLGASVEQHMTLFLLIGALSGWCEGWIFFWRQGKKL